jgi:hypothetical protein
MYRVLALTLLFLLAILGTVPTTQTHAQTSDDISDAQYERLRQALLKGEGSLSQGWRVKRIGNQTPTCTTGDNANRHPGVDYGRVDAQHPLLGKPVYSPVSGTVITARPGADCQTLSCLSTLAVYNQQANKTYIFLHMTGVEKWNPKDATKNKVSVGDVVGFVGQRGPATGPHIHYEVRAGRQISSAGCVTGTINPYTNTFADGPTGPPAPGPQQTSWEFNNDNDLEGWNLHNFSAYSVHGGLLFIDPSGADPWIESPPISVDAGVFRTVVVRMASNGRDGNGYIYFKRQGDVSYSEERKVFFSVNNCGPSSGCYGNAGFYEYSKDMYAAHSLWRGTITGIRIDPADNGVAGTNRDTIGFDYVRLLPVISTSAIFDPPQAFDVSADISPVTPVANQPATMTATVTNPSMPADGLNVRAEIYDSESQQIFSKTFENQSFDSGETRTFNYSWTPPSAGNYKVKTSVWNDTWSDTYSDSLYAKSFAVTAPSGPPPPTSYAIRGRITDTSGTGLSGVDVAFFSYNVTPDDAFTDGAGSYVAQPAYAGVNYVLIPVKQGYYFSPRYLRFNDLRADQTANFVAYSSPAQGPQIATEQDGQTAVSLESAVMMTGPFSSDSTRNFSADERNRIMLFVSGMGTPQDGMYDPSDLQLTGETTVDGETITFFPEVENFSRVPGQESLTSVVVKLPDDIYVTGEAWLTLKYLGATSNRVKIKVAPASLRYFYAFEEGGPGTPGDGVVINASGGQTTTGFDISRPLHLGGYAADGLTLTAFFPANTPALSGVSYGVVTNRDPGPCRVGFGASGGFTAGQVTAEGATGYFVNMTPSDISGMLRAANSFYPGCNFTADDLSIGIIYLYSGGSNPITVLDAMAVGRGANNFAGAKAP